ncbi:hypothetical protein L208DRAFT_1317850, partial [Tricholoma matsutake]
SAVPAYFDTAFVIEDPTHYQHGTPFPQGMFSLHVAQVCAIFNLPPQFSQLPHPLAYIKWFTALGQLDRVTGMYSVHHSTCHHRPNAKIIAVDHIFRSAHLMGKSGQEINCNWMTSNILEKASSILGESLHKH